MTKKDYEMLAAAIRSAREDHERGELTGILRTQAAITVALEVDNPRFDRNVFAVACMPRAKERIS